MPCRFASAKNHAVEKCQIQTILWFATDQLRSQFGIYPRHTGINQSYYLSKMNSTSGKSQLEHFEEALKGLTPKEDDDIPPAPISSSSESKENHADQSASHQHVDTIDTERRPGSKLYYLITRSSLSKFCSKLATSKNVSVVGKATITTQNDLSLFTCTNPQGFSSNYENTQWVSRQEQWYDLKAA